MKRRRGTSLVELMLMMSACAVVLTLSAELIHRLMSAQSQATSLYRGERSAQRLSLAFRHDVHDADGEIPVEADADNQVLLQLKSAGGRVEYRREESAIERLVLNDGSVEARERFDFHHPISASLRRQSSGLLTLSVETLLQAPSLEDEQLTSQAFITPVRLEAAAVLGRTRRIPDEPMPENTP